MPLARMETTVAINELLDRLPDLHLDPTAPEPVINGVAFRSPPATEDTIFDVASLTKPLATATAVIQLYEQGKVAFDDPVQKYLPDFNPSNDPQRANVTVRMLLTHTSGEPGDLDLKDPWRLDGADKAEGIHRYIAMGWTSRGTCCSSPQLG
jgi:CubicO group peptidase (beta-lactamase class C family)